MTLRFKTASLLVALVALVGVLAVVLMPRSVSAEAGSGGGGGSSGCSAFNYSTCFGAVWRYYKTSSNSYAIKNVGAGYTYVNGCASNGGFFAYVLVHKNYPNDPAQVRSWQIGPANGESGNRSRFFGGWTAYRVASNPSDPIPTNPGSGDYSWYSVEKAFAQTTSLGQGRGYQWNGSSSLGWFCYRGTSYTLTPSVTSDQVGAESQEPVNITPRVNNAGPSASYSTYWTISSMTYASSVTPPTAVATGNNGGLDPPDPARPCSYYTGTGATNCQFLSEAFGTGVFQVGSPSTFSYQSGNTWGTKRFILGDYSVGTKVCYALSVYSRDQQTGTSKRWAHSAPVCTVISKKPKIQIHGGDLIVGRSFVNGAAGQSSGVNTSQTVKVR